MKQLYTDLWLAVGFLTRLPTPTLPGQIDLARALAAAPLVGAGIGLAAAAIFSGCQQIGLTPLIAALVTVGCTIALTGALHEDGLADCADGLGGRDIDGKLAIMKDSRIGSYGTLALIIAVGLRVAALIAVPDATAALIAAHAGARGGFAAALRYMPKAREGGLATLVGKPGLPATVIALATAGAIVMWFGDLSAMAAGLLIGIAVLWLAFRQIGGVTGDVLGAQAVLIEIAILLACGVL
jgi:adenosylcobinamide-GDP ribazoletransferase